MNVAYLTEVGKKFGYGHVKRAEAFSQILAGSKFNLCLEQGSDPLFKESASEIWDASKPIEANFEKYELLIVDSFIIGDAFVDSLRHKNCVVFLDDFIRRDVDFGLVVDWTPGAEKRLRQRGSHQLVGLEYLVTRKIFWEKEHIKRWDGNAKLRVVSVFGGSDPKNMTARVINISHAVRDRVDFQFIATRNYPSQAILRRLNNSVIDPPDGEYVRLLRNADLVICAGGQTLYELAAIGVPAAAVCVTRDQEEDIAAFSELGSCIEIGLTDFEAELTDFLSNISSEILIQMSEASRHILGSGELLKAKLLEYANDGL